MNRLLLASLVASMLGSLAGCAGDNDELVQWMEQEHRNVRPNVPPIYPPKKFEPQPYEGSASTEPFGQQKLLAGGAAGVVRAPNAAVLREQKRPPEPLESFPLDSMTMVGALIRSGQAHALLKVDNLLHDVKVHEHLGQNFGEIVKISETELTLREWVQDAAGEWVERTSTLQLQEKAR